MRSQQSPNPLGLDRFRGVINGFLAGLIVGMFVGWFFHGFVGLVVRLGFVLVLLIPIAIVVWYFFLRRKGGGPAQRRNSPGGMQVYTWSSDQPGQRYTADPRQPRRPDPEREAPASRQSEDEIIDLEFEELKRKVDDEGRRS